MATWSYYHLSLEFCLLERPGQPVKYIREGYKKRVGVTFKTVGLNCWPITLLSRCTNMMIQNALNFASVISVKFCHARFLSALNEMLATLEWPSTAMLRHFIKPTVANVCATRAHLFAQNPLKVIFNLIWPTSWITLQRFYKTRLLESG